MDMATGIPPFSLRPYFQAPSWEPILAPEFDKAYFQQMEENLREQYEASKTIYPRRDLIFNCFKLTPFDEVRVVILGQDPYPNEKADGLAFSVAEGQGSAQAIGKILGAFKKNIPKFERPEDVCLKSWALQGVLLLNITLTVEADKSNSHEGIGWSVFTDHVISALNQQANKIVFILMGNFAQSKALLIDHYKHHVIITHHPVAPAAQGYDWYQCFSETNDVLSKAGRGEIDWTNFDYEEPPQ